MSIDATHLETYRTALTGLCYRMLGSVVDAEDAVQEAMVRAWKSLGRFEERASLKTWLYRIATNVCLDELSSRSRRARPFEEGPSGSISDELKAQPREYWLEPIPDARAIPTDADPFEQASLRQSIRLAFVAALQRLPPRQRAALVLGEVLGCSAAEIAECLNMSVPAVNSALQRARATLASRSVSMPQEALSREEGDLLDRYVDAFHRYDVDALVSLLRQDATLSMPPYTLWLRGGSVIRDWLLGPGYPCRGSRLIRTHGCGVPAFAQYRVAADGGYEAWAIVVLEIADGQIASWNSFLDTHTLFPRFGFPLRLNNTDEVAKLAKDAVDDRLLSSKGDR